MVVNRKRCLDKMGKEIKTTTDTIYNLLLDYSLFVKVLAEFLRR